MFDHTPLNPLCSEGVTALEIVDRLVDRLVCAEAEPRAEELAEDIAYAMSFELTRKMAWGVVDEVEKLVAGGMGVREAFDQALESLEKELSEKLEHELCCDCEGFGDDEPEQEKQAHAEHDAPCCEQPEAGVPAQPEPSSPAEEAPAQG